MSRALLLLAGAPILMSCVVTRDLEYQPPPNYPASVHGTTETPMERFYTQQVGETVGADAGAGAMELTLFALVRDPNVDDDLEGLLFVNRDPMNPGDGLVRQFTIPSNGNFERERVQLTVPNGELERGTCNVVELHVSRSFSPFPELAPQGTALDGLSDLAVGSWFVAAIGEDGLVPTVDVCPSAEEGP